MNWSFGASAWVIVLGVLILAGAAFISWLNWTRSGRRKAIGRLEMLRFILIAFLTLTLLRPEIVQVVRSKEQPEVAILVDRSGSMKTRDVASTNLVSRQDWVNGELGKKFWNPLAGKTRVVVDEFGAPPAGTNKTANARSGTDLNEALEAPLSRDRNLKAVLLLSDGDWNTGRTPLAAAAEYRERDIPVFTVAVGSDTSLPDLALEVSTPPSYGLFGEQITIPFVIKSHLTNEVKTTLTLKDGSREETQKEIVIPANNQLQDSILWYPRAVGDAQLTLSIPVQPGESIAENNQQTFRISVRVDKLKVLLVDSLPRWEYRYLRNALARDPGVEMHSILFHPGMQPGGGRNYLPAFPNTRDAIANYDVIFLGDVGIGKGELSEEDASLIKGLVEQQGSGLVFLPGRRGRELTFTNSALSELLPVVFDSAKPNGLPLQNEGVLTLTAMGKGHLLTRFETDENLNGQLWQNLPGFYWSAGVEKSRPGSEVLGVHSSLRNASGRLPLLVIRSAGNGKVLFMGTDSAWRWRRGVEDKYHYRFWSQVVRWMAHQRHLAEKEGIRLTYSPERPSPNDTVYLQTSVLNQSGFPAEDGSVAGTITSPSGRAEQIQFTPVEGGWGMFKSDFIPLEAGAYKIKLESLKHGRKLETELLVHQPVLEEIGRPINRGILADISALTRGELAGIKELDSIIQKISLTPEPKPLEKRIRIWSSPYWGGLILLLLTTYWIGRKVAGML
ncbi:MAG: hypothetical protein ACTHMT_02195 [Verrucomicrobiota bacterium]